MVLKKTNMMHTKEPIRVDKRLSTEAIETGAIKDLLEACKQIVWKLSHNHDDGNGGTKPATITRNDATVRMAVAAIAKAEGEKH